MDRSFYEFWGQLFLNMARGQQTAEEMSAWMKQGFTAMNDLSRLFQQCYGLDAAPAGDIQESPAWQRAMADFQQAFAQFGAQWGWVPQAEHQKALDTCAALEKEIQAQQETIAQLRELLAQEGLGHTELFKHLQDSLQEQSSQFHALMESIRKAAENK